MEWLLLRRTRRRVAAIETSYGFHVANVSALSQLPSLPDPLSGTLATIRGRDCIATMLRSQPQNSWVASLMITSEASDVMTRCRCLLFAMGVQSSLLGCGVARESLACPWFVQGLRLVQLCAWCLPSPPRLASRESCTPTSLFPFLRVSFLRPFFISLRPCVAAAAVFAAMHSTTASVAARHLRRGCHKAS